MNLSPRTFSPLMRTSSAAFSVDSSRLPIIEVNYETIPTVAEFREGHEEFVRIIHAYQKPVGFLIDLANMPRRTAGLARMRAASEVFAEYAPQLRPFAVAEARIIENPLLRAMTTTYDRLIGIDKWPVRSFSGRAQATRWLEQALSLRKGRPPLPARRPDCMRTQFGAIEIRSERLPIVDVHYRGAPSNEELREAFDEFVRVASENAPVVFLIRFEGFPFTRIGPARLLGLADVIGEYVEKLRPHTLAEARIVKNAAVRRLAETMEMMVGSKWPVRSFPNMETAETWLAHCQAATKTA